MVRNAAWVVVVVVAVVTALGVLTVGILQGILVAVVLSLINVIYHISRPHDALLDDVDASGGTVYRGVADKDTSLTEPGLIVYRFDAPLVFANAAYFTERLEDLVANASGRPSIAGGRKPNTICRKAWVIR